MPGTKVVQTKIDLQTYRILKTIAVQRGVPLKEVIRESPRAYAEAKEMELLKEVQKDPIWKGIGLLKTEDSEANEKDTWGMVE